MPEVKNFEVTVQDILYPDRKIPFYRIKTVEQGFISLTGADQAKRFEKNNCYEVQCAITDKGYKNDGMFVRKLGDTEAKPPKQYTRPPTNPVDSDRMGTMGMVNGILSGWAQGRPLDEILQVLQNSKGKIAKIIDHLNDELHMTKIHGVEVQRRDDLNDEIPY